MQSAYAQNSNSPACNVFGGIFDLIPDSTTAMGGSDPRALTNFNTTTRVLYEDQAFIFRMQASTPQQLAYAPPTTMAHGRGPDDRPCTTDGNPITELLDFRQALVDQLIYGRDTAVAGATVAGEQLAIIQAITEQINQIVTQQNRIVDEITRLQAQLNTGPIIGTRFPIRSQNPQVLAQINALRAQYNALEAQRQQKVAELREPTRKYNRGVAAYYNGVQAVNLATSAVNNLLAITSLGVDKIAPGHYRVAGNNNFFPPGRAATKGEIEGNGPISTAQVAAAQGDKNWLGSPFFVNNLGAVTLPQCPSVIPSSQAMNFKLTTAGDASTSEDGGVVLLSVGDQTPIPIPPIITDQIRNSGGVQSWLNQIGSGARNNFTQMTGISSLLEGQTQYQALNVYAEPDPVDNRLVVLWSVMAQNNVRNESGVSDLRNPDTEGNMLDCNNVDRSVDQSQQSCRGEAVRFQITSPLLLCRIPIPEVQVPPAPPGLPPVPTPRVPPPPPPPPQTH